jgi:DNA polymerase III alpha subunit
VKQFATVHCHPASLDSASTPLAFVKREIELGSPAVVCTDHGTLQAAYQIYELARAKKWADGKEKTQLTPVVGLEGYFRDDDCPILTKLGIPKTDTVPHGSNREEWQARYPNGTFFDYLKYMHITLHFRDQDAYLCAVKMLSKADERAEKHGSERKPMFDWAAIEELASHNVTATSSCLIGMVQRHLMGQENGKAATAYFERLKHLFGDRFYAEVFPHACTHDYVKSVFIDVEDLSVEGGKRVLRYKFEKKLRVSAGTGAPQDLHAEELADKYDSSRHVLLTETMHYRKWTPFDPPLKILAVRKVEGFVQNECRPWALDSDIQRGCNRYVMLLAKRHGVPLVIGDDSHFAHPHEKRVQDTRLAQSGPWRFHNSYHRQSSDEAFKYFSERMNVSETEFEGWVDNSLAWVEGFKGFKFDTEPSLPTKFFPQGTLLHTKKLLEHHGRIIRTPEYMKRLGSELNVLHRNKKRDLLPYFQVDEEVVRLYSDEGILTGPGRGSAAGLYFTYALGITHVDPLKYGLSAERFITPDRIEGGKLPDIDQDLPHRDLLEGGHVTDVVDFLASDGTRHSVPASFRVETPEGWLPMGEVTKRRLEFKPWWVDEGQQDWDDRFAAHRFAETDKLPPARCCEEDHS